jgi:hypothetical protein
MTLGRRLALLACLAVGSMAMWGLGNAAALSGVSIPCSSGVNYGSSLTNVSVRLTRIPGAPFGVAAADGGLLTLVDQQFLGGLTSSQGRVLAGDSDTRCRFLGLHWGAR